MKLYEVPNKSYVRLLVTNEVFFFDHPDGMYSYCKDVNGNTVHLFVAEEVEIVEGF